MGLPGRPTPISHLNHLSMDQQHPLMPDAKGAPKIRRGAIREAMRNDSVRRVCFIRIRALIQIRSASDLNTGQRAIQLTGPAQVAPPW